MNCEILELFRLMEKPISSCYWLLSGGFAYCCALKGVKIRVDLEIQPFLEDVQRVLPRVVVFVDGGGCGSGIVIVVPMRSGE